MYSASFDIKTHAVRSGLMFCVVLALSGCMSSSDSTSGTATTPVIATPTAVQVPETTQTGRAASFGFSPAVLPANAAAITPPAQFPGNSQSATALTQPTASNVVTLLTFSSRTQRTATQTGTLDSPTAVTIPNPFATRSVNARGNQYVGIINEGGDALIAGFETRTIDMPATGQAIYQGQGDVVYVNAPTAQSFQGTMQATVTADFANGRVDILMNAPSGTIEGTAYSGAGQIAVNALTLSGARYAHSSSSTASVTGFTGATGLFASGEGLSVQGMFAGPTASETGAVLSVTDGVNGTAAARITARQ